MTTTRSSAIRFGLSRPWHTRSAELNFFSTNFDTRLRSFFERAFAGPIIMISGAGLSGVLLFRRFNQFTVDIFLQDSKFLDWFWTKPFFRVTRRRRRTKPRLLLRVRQKRFRRYFKLARKVFYRSRFIAFSARRRLYRTYFFRTRRYKRIRRRVFYLKRFRRYRRYVRRVRKYRRVKPFKVRTKRRFRRMLRKMVKFGIFKRLIWVFKNSSASKTVRRISEYKYLYEKFKSRRRDRREKIKERKRRRARALKYRKKYFKRFRRFRKKRRVYRKKKIFRNRFYYKSTFIKHFYKFGRFRFFEFYTRWVLSTTYRTLGVPIHLNLHFIANSLNSTQFYLNYITTKLYYRYILTDVVRPIVRMSLRYYRGFRITCKGRFTRAQIAIERTYTRGSLKLSTIHVPIDYGQKFVVLKYGSCNLKIWIRY